MFFPSPRMRALKEGRQRVHAAWVLGWPVGDRMVATLAAGVLAAGDLKHLSELWRVKILAVKYCCKNTCSSRNGV